MKVEREIAGFAFPFAAGVTAAVITGASPCTTNPTYHILAWGTILLSSILLMHPGRKDWRSGIQWGLIFLCALSCGGLMGLSGVELSVSEITPDGPLAHLASRAGEALQDAVDRIPFGKSSTAGIIKALLSGNREDIPPEVSQSFRASGASHILALSGLHLGIIYMMVVRILSIIGNTPRRRRLRSVLAICTCGLYTLATGAGASIMRAFIFIVIRETGEMAGRHTSLKTVLATALVLHLAFDPGAVSEIGFQLSYAAIFGIAYIFPWLRDNWKNDWPWLGKIWESTAISISCQLTTGPLAWYYFGSLPQYFLLTNLIAVPLAGMIIPSALVTVVLTSIGYCPEFLTGITEGLTTMMVQALSIIASM